MFTVSDAFDFDLIVDTLQKLKEGKHVNVPIYDFNTHSRAKYTVRLVHSSIPHSLYTLGVFCIMYDWVYVYVTFHEKTKHNALEVSLRYRLI